MTQEMVSILMLVTRELVMGVSFYSQIIPGQNKETADKTYQQHL